MQYVSAKEKALEWNITVRQVQILCGKNAVDGAKKVGSQWIIPQDAKKPGDRRTKSGRNISPAPVAEAEYHFPLLIFTRYYVSQSGLSEEEKELLNYQELYLQGRFIEGLQKCRQLLEKNPARHVSFGLHMTAAFNSMSLGFYNEYISHIGQAKKIASESPERKDDYGLIIGSCEYRMTYNRDYINETDINALSSDAVYYYQIYQILISAFSATSETSNAVWIYESVCRQAEESGLVPVSAFIRSVLSAMHFRRNETEAFDFNARKCISTFDEKHWNCLLGLYYMQMPEVYEGYIREKGQQTLARATDISKMLVSGFRVIKIYMADNISYRHGMAKYNAVMHLIAYGKDEDSICSSLGITKEEYKKQTEEICSLLNIEDSRRIAEHLRQLFRSESR